METLQTLGIRPKRPYDLSTPWAGNRIASTDELAGRQVSLTRDDGQAVEFAFDAETVRWRGTGDEAELTAPYDAVVLREQIYFVQILHPDREVATSIALNLQRNCAVLATNTLKHGDGRTDLQQELYPCVVTESDGVAPELSRELIGKRAYAEYADGHTVEHVYFNPRRILWQGIGRFDYSGAECDVSTTWKLDDRLYVLTWVEEWQAVGVVLVLDYDANRNAGVLFGHDDNGFLHTLCGARLQLLDDLTYPAGYEPGGMTETETI